MSKHKKRKRQHPPRHKRKQSRLIGQSRKMRGQSQDILAAWTQQLIGRGLLSEQGVIIDPSGYDKMSDNLLELLGEFTDMVKTEKRIRALIFLASVAWNASLMSEQNREDFLEPLLKEIPDDLRDFIDILIARKLLLFPDNNRFILDSQLVNTGDSYQVSVISTLLIKKTFRE